MIKKPFEQWLSEDVELAFALKRIEDLPALQTWLEVSNPLPLTERFEKLRLYIRKNVEYWNEDELKMLFIAPFLLELDFDNLPHYRIFTQRMFTIQTPEIEASGKVEWFIATGKQTPRKPFFFLQEAPQPPKGENLVDGNDPLGQLLIAMVEAQIMNATPSGAGGLLYGCYNIGRIWFFVVLIGKEYGVSRAYDATQTDDLTDMVAILKKVKVYIHQELGLPIV